MSYRWQVALARRQGPRNRASRQSFSRWPAGSADLILEACRDSVIWRRGHEPFTCKPRQHAACSTKANPWMGNSSVWCGWRWSPPAPVARCARPLRLLRGDDRTGRTADGRFHDTARFRARWHARSAGLSIAADVSRRGPAEPAPAGGAPVRRRKRSRRPTPSNGGRCRRSCRPATPFDAAAPAAPACMRIVRGRGQSEAEAALNRVFRGIRKLTRDAEICWYFDLYLFLTSGHNTASIELPRASRSRHISADVCCRHAGHGRPAQPMKQGVLES